MTSVMPKKTDAPGMKQPLVVNLIKPQDIPEAVKKFSRAATDLMCNKKTGFYSALLMQTPVYWTRDIPTAGVDIRARMFVNPDFILKLKRLSEVVFLVAHELEHLLRLHPTRQGNRDPMRWNIACDAPMNADLVADGIGSFIQGGVDMPETKGMTPDAVYNTLPTKPPPSPDQPGGGEGEDECEGEGEGEGGGGGDGPGGPGHDIMSQDALEGGQMTESQVLAAEGEIKSKIAAAAQTARVSGNMSAEMQRRVDEVLDVKTPWYEVLERFMTQKSEADYSWAKPNRRFASRGLILPSLASVSSLGKTVIIRDVSGSIDEETEHKPFIGHINSIGTRCLPSELHVLDVSNRVHHCHDFYPHDFPIAPEIKGGGGTDLTAGFDYINAEFDGEVAVCIVLTDGYTPWPSHAQDYPVVVVCTTDVDVDYGDEVIRYVHE